MGRLALSCLLVAIMASLMFTSAEGATGVRGVINVNGTAIQERKNETATVINQIMEDVCKGATSVAVAINATHDVVAWAVANASVSIDVEVISDDGGQACLKGEGSASQTATAEATSILNYLVGAACCPGIQGKFEGSANETKKAAASAVAEAYVEACSSGKGGAKLSAVAVASKVANATASTFADLMVVLTGCQDRTSPNTPSTSPSPSGPSKPSPSNAPSRSPSPAPSPKTPTAIPPSPELDPGCIEHDVPDVAVPDFVYNWKISVSWAGGAPFCYEPEQDEYYTVSEYTSTCQALLSSSDIAEVADYAGYLCSLPEDDAILEVANGIIDTEFDPFWLITSMAYAKQNLDCENNMLNLLRPPKDWNPLTGGPERFDFWKKFYTRMVNAAEQAGPSMCIVFYQVNGDENGKAFLTIHTGYELSA